MSSPFRTATNYIILKPAFLFVSLTLLALAYAAVNNRKIQSVLLGLPYDRLFRSIKSERMIIFYATVFEVIFELVTMVILAGVSILITSWLLFEEAAERGKRHATSLGDLKQHAQENETDKDENPSLSPIALSPKFSQQTYHLSPNPSLH